MNVKVHYFSLKLCIESDQGSTKMQHCLSTFMHSWLYTLGSFGMAHSKTLSTKTFEHIFFLFQTLYSSCTIEAALFLSKWDKTSLFLPDIDSCPTGIETFDNTMPRSYTIF